MFKRVCLILLAAAFAVAPVSTVLADKPVVYSEGEETVPYYEVPEPCNEGLPSEFHIIQSFTVKWRETLFFDNAGNPVRAQGHVMFSGTLTNSVTGTIITDAPDPQNWVYDFRDGTYAIHGLAWSINVPGEGIVLLDAGNIIFYPDGSVVVHGPHQVYEGGLAVLCAALE